MDKKAYGKVVKKEAEQIIKRSNEILKPIDAAEYLCCSYWKIMDMVRRKQVPHYRIGNRVLFRKDALDEWIIEQEKKVNINDGGIII